MGEKFGENLILEECIAAGGMAEVFRAKLLGTSGFEKIVAVKRILPSYAMNIDFQVMFQKEAQTTARFHHPNIVQVYSNGEHNGYAYLVMEFVQGKNLREVFYKSLETRQALSVPFCLHIAAEVCKALHYAHNFCPSPKDPIIPVIHRDISPQNIMLSFDGSVKVVDFGIAKALTDISATQTGVVKGKVGFLSPEQALGKAIDVRSDIFSLGVVIYELLTGTHLFSDDDKESSLKKLIEAPIQAPSQLNSQITKDVDGIILNCLKRNPQERYPNALLLCEDLSRILSKNYPDFLSTQLSQTLRKLFPEDYTSNPHLVTDQATEASSFQSSFGSAQVKSSWTKKLFLIGAVLAVVWGVFWYFRSPAPINQSESKDFAAEAPPEQGPTEAKGPDEMPIETPSARRQAPPLPKNAEARRFLKILRTSSGGKPKPISKDMFKGSVEEFERVDTDKDGILRRPEIREYIQKLSPDEKPEDHMPQQEKAKSLP